MKKQLSIFIVILWSCGMFAQQAQDLFKQANEQYRKANYKEALNDYLNIEKTGEKSDDLYYNLANTYYKLNQIAPSIYYYEKALTINPQNQDAKHNLAFAKRMRIDAFEVLPKTVLQRLNENIIYTISYNTWAYISVIFAFSIGLFFLLYYYASYTHKKRLFFILGIISIVLLIVSVSFSYKAAQHYKHENPAIVFSPKVSVKSEPQLSASENFILHEGTKVQIEKRVDDWYKIKLSDGKIGWIPKSDIRRIKE